MTLLSKFSGEIKPTSYLQFNRKFNETTLRSTRSGLVLGLRPDLNQKCSSELLRRSKLTKCPEEQEEEELK